jgi:glyoxylase-like metal-dependent hydrolase (beta-lactamase superfamily II)
MNGVEVTGVAQQRSWETDSLPPVEHIDQGLWSVPVPIPNNPLRYVLVYLLELDDGVAVVDTGWNTDEAWTALGDGLRVAGYAVSDVKAALITHIHPDHYGLAGRLRAESGAWVALHRADAELIPARYGIDIESLLQRMRTLLTECGVPDDSVEQLSGASMGIREFVALAEPDVLLEDRSALPLAGWDLIAVHTPGHSPGHVCFYAPGRRLLLSGDHVLPRISPNIAVHAQQPGNPLADFLDALARVRELDVDEVLPAHEWRFRGLRPRVDELIKHHGARLDETEAALRAAPGLTCWETALKLRWSRDWAEITGFMQRAAVGETLAHLVLLESRRRVRREGSKPERWYAVARSHKEPER